MTETPGGRKLGASMGIPIPKFAYIPFLNSLAARLTIFSRLARASPPPPADWSSSLGSFANVNFSIFFSAVDLTTRST